jgi:hypothetical protein
MRKFIIKAEISHLENFPSFMCNSFSDDYFHPMPTLTQEFFLTTYPSL